MRVPIMSLMVSKPVVIVVSIGSSLGMAMTEIFARSSYGMQVCRMLDFLPPNVAYNMPTIF